VQQLIERCVQRQGEADSHLGSEPKAVVLVIRYERLQDTYLAGARTPANARLTLT